MRHGAYTVTTGINRENRYSDEAKDAFQPLNLRDKTFETSSNLRDVTVYTV